MVSRSGCIQSGERFHASLLPSFSQTLCEISSFPNTSLSRCIILALNARRYHVVGPFWRRRHRMVRMCRPTTWAPPPPPPLPLKELRSPSPPPNWVLIQEGASADGRRAGASHARTSSHSRRASSSATKVLVLNLAPVYILRDSTLSPVGSESDLPIMQRVMPTLICA